MLLMLPGRLAFLQQHSERLELKNFRKAEKRPTSFAVFSRCPVGWIERHAFPGGDDRVYSCLETVIMEDKLTVAVAGYLELYDLPGVTRI